MKFIQKFNVGLHDTRGGGSKIPHGFLNSHTRYYEIKSHLNLTLERRLFHSLSLYHMTPLDQNIYEHMSYFLKININENQ